MSVVVHQTKCQECHYLNQWWLFHWILYASPDPNVFNLFGIEFILGNITHNQVTPVYWGWLYVFVPVRTPPPPPPPPPPLPPPPAADSCSRDNFWMTFWISFIFSTIVDPDLQITWLDFGRFSSWPWPRFFKVKYGICYISTKNGPIATKRKANISIEL